MEALEGVEVSALNGVESLLGVHGPIDGVDEKSHLRRVVVDPGDLVDLVTVYTGLTSLVTEGASHDVDDILHVDLDLSLQFKGVREVHDFLAHTGVHLSGVGAFTIGDQGQVLDGLEDLGGVFVDLFGVISVGQDVEEIILGYEIKTGEESSLSIQEVVQGLLANLQLTLDLVQTVGDASLGAVFESVFDSDSLSHDIFHVFVDAHELLRFSGEFFLDFFRSNEKVLQEGPGLLNLDQFGDHFFNVSQVFLPLFHFFFEVGHKLRRRHIIDQVLVFFEGFEVFFRDLDRLDGSVLVLQGHEFHRLPLVNHLFEGFADLEFLFRGIGDVFDRVLDLEQLQVPNELHCQLVVDGELAVGQLSHLGPVSVVFDGHGAILKLG